MRILIPLLTIICLLFHLTGSAQTFYISSNGTGDGSSWANASGDLRNLIATSPSGAEIWIAAGVYFPDPMDRDASFLIPSGVKIYGGFNGSETSRSQRNPASNLTILSGAIGSTTNEDNSYSVVKTIDASSETLVDGVIIEYGNANGESGGFNNPSRAGGGWHNLATNGNESSPTINNCTFRNNYAIGFGAGLVNIATAAVCTSLITNSIFENNNGGNDGGAIYNGGTVNGNCQPHIVDCIFDGNTTDNGGGAIYNNGQDGLCNPIIDRCIIQNNYAGYAGGGIYSFGKDGTANAQISNCLILNNVAEFGGGGVYNLGNGSGSASPTVVNCTFTLNSSVVGGAMYNNAADPEGTAAPIVTNCIFWNNPVSAFGSVFRANYGTPTISYSIVDEASCNDLNSGTASNVTCGPGMIYNLDPNFTNTYGIPIGSPAINAGNNSILSSLGISLDLNQDDRIQNSLVDLGATETFSPDLDVDGDGITDALDNCPNIPNTNQLDQDQDNFGALCDCDDTDANFNDNAIEICDGIDNNCNGIIDEGFDVDGDGFKTCEGDCDDTDPTVFPGAIEVCDGIDNNCNSVLDEGAQPIAHYPDADGDLLGDADATPSFNCPPLPGYVMDNSDCDDNNEFLPQTPGNFCNDGNPNTTNDMIQNDGCSCLGVPINSGYCASLGLQPWEEWIGNISLSDLDNTSEKSGYSDFTSMIANVNLGEDYELSILPVFSYSHYTEYIQVWIDFNQNESFDDPGELVISTIYNNGIDGTVATPVTESITIPSGALTGETRMRVSMARDQASNPCEVFDIGEVEDYTIDIMDNGSSLSIDCETDLTIDLGIGTTSGVITWNEPTTISSCPNGQVNILQTNGPAIGTIQTTGIYNITYEATDNCGNIETCSFTVTINDGGLAALNINCPTNQNLTTQPGETSITANWDIPVSITNCPLGVTNILQTNGLTSGSSFPIGTNTITYEAIDDCGNIESCSFIITVNDGGPIANGYCESVASMPWQEWIGNVALNDLDNPSQKSNYSDFTSLTANLEIGGTYQISVQPIFSYTHETEYIQVWIDYNQNESFADPGELVFSTIYTNGVDGSVPDPLTGDITIPTGVDIGNTRMRVSMQRDQPSGPCDFFDIGEVEDYTVNLINDGPILNISCPSDLNITAAIGSSSEIISWEIPNINATCPTGNTNLIQTNGPTNGSIQSVGTYGITYEATDDCGNIASCSFVITVSDGGPIGNGYCDSAASAPWEEWIGNVDLNDLDNTSGKNGYGDFTTMIANVEIGGTYNLSIQPVFSYTHSTEYFQVWIDFNGNENFNDPGELVLSSIYENGVDGTIAPTISQDITIPTDAINGNARMRITMSRDEAVGPCENFTNGEVEDYTINIGTAPVNAVVNTNLIFNLTSNLTDRMVHLNWTTNLDTETIAYSIERKDSNGDFIEIDRVETLNDYSQTYFYTYQDGSVTNGSYEYRIVAQKNDGTTLFTNVQKVNLGKIESRLTAFPNPATTEVTLMSPLLADHSINLMITNTLGQIVHQKDYDSNPDQRIIIDLSSYHNGFYLIRFQAKNKKAIHTRLVVEKD